jgi:hypothetical protein
MRRPKKIEKAKRVTRRLDPEADVEIACARAMSVARSIDNISHR